MNLMLHGIDSDPEAGGIHYGDTLSPEGQALPKATPILTNPPFGTKKGGGLPSQDDFTYAPRLKAYGRALRGNLTEAEQKLWYRLRRKQINGWQFYRQKPVGPYIVYFFCPAAALIVELDGDQHFEDEHRQADQKRDAYRVLRFDNRQALMETDAVVEMIALVEIPP